MAIIAYSAMRQRRVMVHEKPYDGDVKVDEQSHPSVAGKDGVHMLHIFYNGVDHYDALVELDGPSGFPPAWPQPPPPEYVAAETVPEQDSRSEFNDSKPKKKAASKTKAAQPHTVRPVGAQQTAPSAPPQPADPEVDLLQELANGSVAEASSHPHRVVEDLVKDLAEQRLREHPTVPPGATLAEKDAGALWPRVFCAFDGCCWSEQDGTEEALHHHLAEVHATDLQGIAKHMLRGRADDALFSIYSAAIAEKCRSQAPLAGASLDRTALRSLANATADEQVESLVCVCCGGVFPYVHEIRDKGDIQWRKPLRRQRPEGEANFFGQNFSTVHELIGLDSYLQKYDIINTETGAAAIDELKENMTSEAERGGLAAWRRLIGPYIAHFFGFHARRRSYTKTGICSINLILRPCAFEDDGTAKISKRKACHPEAPEVGVEAWGAAMQRQVASQFRRDWNFPPTLWNYLFRTKINLQQNSHIFSVPNEFGPGRRMLTNEEIQEGTEHIYQLLRYVDINGEEKAIAGDFTKLRHAPHLSPAALKVLSNTEARTRTVPGTHEVRKTMRYQTHSYRVPYGLACFFTFSPSERDSTIMLRMARARQSDPAINDDKRKAFYQRTLPPLDIDFLRLSPEALAEALPDYDERKSILARDPLACLNGFLALVGLAFRHIFGIRLCPRCPDCANSNCPCTDAFGSNATAAGGVFGRFDAAFGSLECQKSGSYHLHGQFFLQCYHQFKPLSELVNESQEQLLELLRKYSDYSAHVTRKVYCDPESWTEERDAVEAQWPEYRGSSLMLSRPSYQSDAAMPAPEWLAAYLSEDAEALQKHKQHHVHVPDDNGKRQPLDHCRDPKDHTKCKSFFPRDAWLTSEAILICSGLAGAKGMPCKSKRSMVGMPWGPCNDPNLNGNHPALLAALRCNGDVQLPFRFPITPITHNTSCDQQCDQKMPIWTLVREAQINQSAQVGYQCDYANKRLKIATREVKEWMKGQNELYLDLSGKPTGYLGARVSKRLATDLFARGVCRGAVECTNLILNAAQKDPTRAESIKTAQLTEIALAYPLQLLRAVAAHEPWPKEVTRAIVDKRCEARRAIIACPFWTMYGARGQRAEVHMLSACEFARAFDFALATHPLRPEAYGRDILMPGKYHAKLTAKGAEAVAQRKQLVAGLHYEIREEGGADSSWLPLGQSELGQPYRRDWVVVPRKRPHVPVIYGAQGSKSEEDKAMRILVLFFPWVNDARDASANVPFVEKLWVDGARSWREALCMHVQRHGFPTEEVKRFVLNFCFAYCLPREHHLVDGLVENSDNEGVEDDVVLALDEAEMLEATLTHIKGSRPTKEAAGDLDAAEAEQDGSGTTKLHDMTRQMFKLSNSIWLRPSPGARPAQLQSPIASKTMDSEQTIKDHALAKKSAQASRNKATAQANKGAAGLLGVAVGDPLVRKRCPITAALLRDWLRSPRAQENTNAEQHRFLGLVVDRLLVEHNLISAEDANKYCREPMLHLLHGPPGTGKSHCLLFLPFGGVNVLMGGDFFQLPPPEGGFLASVPRQLRASDAAQPDALKEQGLALLWESTRGVVELCQRERCKDIKRNTAVKTLDETAREPKCLKCLQKAELLTCARCNVSKHINEFEPVMATMPAAFVACTACQAHFKKHPHTYHGWFTCRACNHIFSCEAQNNKTKRQRQYCLNCSVQRAPHKNNEHTCRKCSRRWLERQAPSKRKRLCPDCRRK
ncbi:unnamed protein product [Durusdinium trenchii]|uniref:ATP-dependent DNA helicase n=1 Tax=Durusdinium trenchii TaxID=1381693 RepID=A0ABP0PJU8_9DINO